MKQIVLLSGGLDSAVCLAKGVQEGEVKLALTFDYGQRAAAREGKRASQLAQYYGVAWEVVELPFLKRLTATALVAFSELLPELTPDDLENHSLILETADRVWVPNRNGLFLNIAACYAESLGCEVVVAGFNVEEAQTFPDNSGAFVEAVNKAFFFSTRRKVEVRSYTQSLTKPDVARLGAELGLPFELLWSCYQGDEKMCGCCESCRRLQRALQAAGLSSILQELPWIHAPFL